MRILHISTRLILGGSQENTVLSCEGQARLGHEVHLAFGPIYGPEGSLLERVERFRTDDGRGITTHVVPHLVRQVRPWSDRRARRELVGLIERLKPDIVHTHSSKAGILGRFAAWDYAASWPQKLDAPTRRGRPAWLAGWRMPYERCGIVHTIHGPPFMPVEGSGFRRAKVRLANAVYTIAERRAAQRRHVIVSVADAMTRQFLQRGIGMPEEYTTVYSGMEVGPYLHPPESGTREAMRVRLGFEPGDFVIGTVARLAEHKGHDDLLDALAEDLRAHADWKLLWVGNGWWRRRLIAKARGLGLRVVELDQGGSPAAGAADQQAAAEGQVILTGLVPSQQVPGLIRAMDVLAHPSYREGLPRTVPQALLAGVPPLAYDTDGTGEVCREGETGKLVPVGDRGGLRAAARWLYDHPDERRAMAIRGRMQCAERFSAEAMVAALEKVYDLGLQRAARKSERRK